MQAFLDHGVDFVQADTIHELVARMNALEPDAPLDPDHVERQVLERDRQLDNPFAKDAQVTAIHGARAYRGDRLTRVATPHRFLDPAHGPLIAVRLSILTRKTLGGLETDLSARVLTEAGEPVPGSSRRARSPASAAAGCTATARSRAPSSVAACSRAGRRAARVADAVRG